MDTDLHSYRPQQEPRGREEEKRSQRCFLGIENPSLATFRSHQTSHPCKASYAIFCKFGAYNLTNTRRRPVARCFKPASGSICRASAKSRIQGPAWNAEGAEA